MSKAPLSVTRLSTAAYADAARVDAWRDVFGHTICGLDIEPIADRPFRAEAVLRVLPNLGVVDGACSGAHYWRPVRRTTSDDLVFVVNHEGRDLARMGGSEAVLAAGQAVLFASDRVGGTTNSGSSRFTTIRIPANAFPNAGDAVLKPVVSDNDALELLRNYLGVLRDANALATARQQQQIVSHIHALIGWAVLPQDRNSRDDRKRAVAAARLHAIRSDIERHARDPDLDVARIAARHRVTPRYVQMLFAQAGTNFSEYLKTARLVAAHGMLTHRDHRHRSVSDIALDVGFSNVSYFNRAFRREFSATPSDIRNGAISPDDKAAASGHGAIDINLP